jgi:hypothetical protein
MTSILSNRQKKAPTPIDCKSVCGLDALYFYIKVSIEEYTLFYHNHLLMGHLESENMEMLSKDYSNQFTYFNYSSLIDVNNDYKSFYPEGSARQRICKIGFKNLNTKDNLFSVIIQMDSIALQQMTIPQIQEHFKNLLNTFGLVPLKYQVSRVDLNTYVFDYPLDWVNYMYFSTKLRKNEPKYDGTQLETFYLGSRGNGLFLRIYDKLNQLRSLDYEEGKKKKYLIALKYVRKYLEAPTLNDVWNIELEMRREQLRTYKIDTLDDLNQKVNSLHKSIFGKSIRLLKEQKKMNTNDSKIENHEIWNHIIKDYDYNGSALFNLDKEKMKQYKRDDIWLKNRLTEYLAEPRNTNESLRLKVNNLLLELNDLTT